MELALCGFVFSVLLAGNLGLIPADETQNCQDWWLLLGDKDIGMELVTLVVLYLQWLILAVGSTCSG